MNKQQTLLRPLDSYTFTHLLTHIHSQANHTSKTWDGGEDVSWLQQTGECKSKAEAHRPQYNTTVESRGHPYISLPYINST